jgi:hypothetical protein
MPAMVSGIMMLAVIWTASSRHARRRSLASEDIDFPRP